MAEIPLLDGVREMKAGNVWKPHIAHPWPRFALKGISRIWFITNPQEPLVSKASSITSHPVSSLTQLLLSTQHWLSKTDLLQKGEFPKKRQVTLNLHSDISFAACKPVSLRFCIITLLKVRRERKKGGGRKGKKNAKLIQKEELRLPVGAARLCSRLHVSEMKQHN